MGAPSPTNLDFCLIVCVVGADIIRPWHPKSVVPIYNEAKHTMSRKLLPSFASQMPPPSRREARVRVFVGATIGRPLVRDLWRGAAGASPPPVATSTLSSCINALANRRVAATPYCSLHPPPAALANVPLQCTVCWLCCFGFLLLTFLSQKKSKITYYFERSPLLCPKRWR